MRCSHLAGGAALLLAACGLDRSGAAVQIDAALGSANLDASTDASREGASEDADASTPDADAAIEAAADCLGFLCNGECVPNCANCSAGEYHCNVNRQCGSCSTCPDSPVGCFSCSFGSPLGVCRAEVDACNSRLFGCICQQASDCPGADQACVDPDSSGPGPGIGPHRCATCGESGTDEKPCAGGGKCGKNSRRCED